jgi:predicted nucleic acid-binding protein
VAGGLGSHEDGHVILADSSVWIDYFRGNTTPQREQLEALSGSEPLAVSNLILAEVLQGFTSEKDFNQAKKVLTSLMVVELGGQDIAIKTAVNFRKLRSIGVTVRKTIDGIIATRCIESGYTLLHSDRDFHPFTIHRHLRKPNGVVENSNSRPRYSA